MNTQLLTKDITLMLKDLKTQIFFLIILMLFILSAISSAVAYKSVNTEFQEQLTAHQEAEDTNLVYLLSSRMLNVKDRPSPAILFSSYPSHPDQINSRVTMFMPSLSKYGQTRNEVFRLDWFFILSVIASFMMLIMSFEAVSAEKRTGTLRLLSVYGIKRQAFLWSKYASYMVLYLFSIIPAALVSLILFFALTGSWSLGFMLKFLLVMLLSLPFASFFALTGIFISMLKNYRSAIVIVVFVWLFFVVIVPQAANLLARQFSHIRTNTEYSQMHNKAFQDALEVMGDDEGGNTKLDNGIRAKAFHNADETSTLSKQIEIDENMRQTRLERAIASISPFAQYEKVSEVIFNKGLYMLDFMLETTKSTITQISNLMVQQDSSDEGSLHLFYVLAPSDMGAAMQFQGKTTFSYNLFEYPNLLFVTDIPTDDGMTKIAKILVLLLPILLLNLFLAVCSVVKLERLDIR